MSQHLLTRPAAGQDGFFAFCFADFAKSGLCRVNHGYQLFAQFLHWSPSGSLLREPIVPHSRGADQICVVSEGRESELRFFGGDEAAAAANHFANAVEKKWGALHYTAAEHDGIGREEVDQIRK